MAIPTHIILTLQRNPHINGPKKRTAEEYFACPYHKIEDSHFLSPEDKAKCIANNDFWEANWFSFIVPMNVDKIASSYKLIMEYIENGKPKGEYK